MVITEIGIPSNDWVLFNINETGFYRVNYDSKNWKMLIEYLTDPEMYFNIGKHKVLIFFCACTKIMSIFNYSRNN